MKIVAQPRPYRIPVTNQLFEALSALCAVVLTALPYVLHQAIQAGYGLIDVWWLGRLSTDAVAGVAAATTLFLLVAAGVIGVAISTAVHLSSSQTVATGSADVRGVLWSKVLIAFLVGVIAAGVGMSIAPTLFHFLGLPPWSLSHVLAVEYFYTRVISAPFFGMVVVAAAALQALGRPWLIPAVGGGTLVLNALLNPIALFWFYGGVRGVAIATVIVEIVAAIVFLTLLIRIEGPPPPLAALARSLRQASWSYLKIGVPGTAEVLLSASASLVFVIFVATFSSQVLATYGAVNQLYLTIFLPLVGIALAVGIESARLHARGATVALRQFVWWGTAGAVALTAFVGWVIAAASPHIAASFMPTDAEARTELTRALRIVFIGIPLTAIGVVGLAVLRALKRSLLALSITGVYLLAQFTVAWWGVAHANSVMLWVAYLVGFFVLAMGAMVGVVRALRSAQHSPGGGRGMKNTLK